MKLGLYLVRESQTSGGAFVVRDDLVQAALRAGGRHHVELLNQTASSGNGHVSRPPSQVRLLAAKALRSVGRVSKAREHARAQKLKQEAAAKGIEVLWFNHAAPVDIGLPYILSVFDVQHRLQPWFPEVSAGGLWDRREAIWVPALRRASIVTVPSEPAKQDIHFLFDIPMDRIRVLPFPTPASMLQATKAAPGGSDIRAKYGIAKDFVFYPAQFWPHKNHVNLLHALHILTAQRRVDMDLVLTGSDHGNLDHIRKTAHDLGLSSRVHFLGFVPREDLLQLYRDAYALVFVSFFGPENLPPLEAQALGCPVVLADIPGVKALFGDGPVLVDPRDPVTIADGIERVAGNPERRQQALRDGQAMARANTPGKYIEGIYEILDDFERVRRCWP